MEMYYFISKVLQLIKVNPVLFFISRFSKIHFSTNHSIYACFSQLISSLSDSEQHFTCSSHFSHSYYKPFSRKLMCITQWIKAESTTSPLTDFQFFTKSDALYFQTSLGRPFWKQVRIQEIPWYQKRISAWFWFWY